MKQVTIYTDGACSGNPGPGGWGAILKYGAHERELSGGEPSTTNNRMELLGAITALQSLHEPCQVSLYTDSQYLANAINLGWLRGWKQKGWRRKDGELKNVEEARAVVRASFVTERYESHQDQQWQDAYFKLLGFMGKSEN